MLIQLAKQWMTGVWWFVIQLLFLQASPHIQLSKIFYELLQRKGDCATCKNARRNILGKGKQNKKKKRKHSKKMLKANTEDSETSNKMLSEWSHLATQSKRKFG